MPGLVHDGGIISYHSHSHSWYIKRPRSNKWKKKKIKSESAALLHKVLQFSLIAFCLFRVLVAPVWDCCETTPAPRPISPDRGCFVGSVALSHLELWTIRASASVVSILTPTAHVPYRSSCFVHHFYRGGDAVPPFYSRTGCLRSG